MVRSSRGLLNLHRFSSTLVREADSEPGHSIDASIIIMNIHEPPSLARAFNDARDLLHVCMYLGAVWGSMGGCVDAIRPVILDLRRRMLTDDVDARPKPSNWERPEDRQLPSTDITRNSNTIFPLSLTTTGPTHPLVCPGPQFMTPPRLAKPPERGPLTYVYPLWPILLKFPGLMTILVPFVRFS